MTAGWSREGDDRAGAKDGVVGSIKGRAASRTPRTLPTTRPLDESPERQPAALVADPGMSSTTSAGGWSASSSRIAITRSVYLPIGIVSPALHDTPGALRNRGGSAGVPSSSSRLNVSPYAIGLPSVSGWDRTAE
jgi:hypothetical protein